MTAENICRDEDQSRTATTGDCTETDTGIPGSAFGTRKGRRQRGDGAGAVAGAGR